MKKVFMCALALLGLSSGGARAFLIDDFNSYQLVYVAAAAPASALDVLADSSVLGGWRSIQVNKTSGGTGFTNTVASESNPGGYKTLQVANGNADSTVVLAWDANGAGLGGIDITDAGIATGVLIKLLATDHPQISLKFEAFSSSGSSSKSVLFTDTMSGLDLYVPFLDFTGSADFSHLNAFKLTMDGSAGWDAAFDAIRTATAPVAHGPSDLPEPAPLALLGLGLALVGLAQRRRPR